MASLRAIGRKFDLRSQFLLTLILRQMKLRILNGSCGRNLNAAVLSLVVLKGSSLTVRYPFVSFDVPSWNAFLEVVWDAFAVASCSSAMSSFLVPMSVWVIMEDGRIFKTRVWFDEDHRGIRYESLY